MALYLQLLIPALQGNYFSIDFYYMNWYLEALKKYAEFSGRATRQEYWMFVLFNFVFSSAASLLDGFIGLTYGENYGTYGLINSIYSLVLFIPGLSVTVRRLHDTTRSGWFMLIALIPIIGWIKIIVVLASRGVEGPNKYGADPQGSNSDAFSSVLDGNI
jgi:uncharacterized membrane protein YhaH (DUF805 family)